MHTRPACLPARRRHLPAAPRRLGQPAGGLHRRRAGAARLARRLRAQRRAFARGAGGHGECSCPCKRRSPIVDQSAARPPPPLCTAGSRRAHACSLSSAPPPALAHAGSKRAPASAGHAANPGAARHRLHGAHHPGGGARARRAGSGQCRHAAHAVDGGGERRSEAACMAALPLPLHATAALGERCPLPASHALPPASCTAPAHTHRGSWAACCSPTRHPTRGR